ncbi:Hypothetical protein P9301_06841 [Prochlorococcus marinus str. MIT 9301]|jgi:hypothetical protein|uniref:Uncharacterized protein n=2 Tax=Prochlorococcaceae TaxID=2881426 RepID=A3PC32_PROM0|nr:Hypothetical protein P9301_06841 [Prochlorococcus marinus str. MIT 9301]
MRINLLVITLLTMQALFPINLFAWGAYEEDKKYCRDVASFERNEFSAKLSYKACLKERKVQREKKEKKIRLENEEKRIKDSISKKRSKLYTKYCNEFLLKKKNIRASIYRDPLTREETETRMLVLLKEITKKLKRNKIIKNTDSFEVKIKKFWHTHHFDLPKNKCDDVFGY